MHLSEKLLLLYSNGFSLNIMSSAKKMISFAIDIDTDKEVDFMAKSEGISRSVVYRKAIKEYLEKKRDEKIIESQKRLEEIEKKAIYKK